MRIPSFSSRHISDPSTAAGLTALRKGNKRQARRIFDQVAHGGPEDAFYIGEKCCALDSHLALRYYKEAAKSPSAELQQRAYTGMALAHGRLQRTFFGLGISLAHNAKRRECYAEAERRRPGSSQSKVNVFSAYLDRYSLQSVGDTFIALQNRDYGFKVGRKRISLRFGLGKHDSKAMNFAFNLFPAAAKEMPAFAASGILTLVQQKMDSSNKKAVVDVVIPALRRITVSSRQRGKAEAFQCLELLSGVEWARPDAKEALLAARDQET